MKRYLPLLLIALVLAAIIGMSQYAESSKEHCKEAAANVHAATKGDDSKAESNGKDVCRPPTWARYFTWPDGVGACAVILTLFVIAWQSAETRRAAEASEASVIAGNQTAKQQLRAYLGITSTAARFRMGVGLVTELHVRNSGQTPAYDVTMWSHARIGSYPHGKAIPPPPGGFPKSTCVLSPQHEHLMNTDPVPVTPEIAQALSTPHIAYFVQGQIRYRDIFKDVHVLNYRLFFGGPGHNDVYELKDGDAVAYLMMDGEGNYED